MNNSKSWEPAFNAFKSGGLAALSTHTVTRIRAIHKSDEVGMAEELLAGCLILVVDNAQDLGRYVRYVSDNWNIECSEGCKESALEHVAVAMFEIMMEHSAEKISELVKLIAPNVEFSKQIDVEEDKVFEFDMAVVMPATDVVQ